ncbi:MAG TPA: lactonase family protein [Terriglobales bacterium]|nr:lactonase family protein [Terriglobales bacterium]
MKLNRLRTRYFLVGLTVFLGLALTLASQGAPTRQYLVYLGTYTDHGGKGIYAFRFDSVSGQLTSLGLAAESPEPSFLAISQNRRFLYAANEILTFNGQPAGAVSAFAVQPDTGKLSILNQVSSRDEGPAHITLDHSGKYVLVSNYTLGSIAVFSLLPDGRIGQVSSFVQHKGSSVNPERQQGPHAHAIVLSPDNRYAIAADLGLDELLEYPFDVAKGTLGNPQVVKTRPGAGPRHLVFGPTGRFLYVINELQSTVVAYTYDARNGRLRELQTISTLPKGLNGENTAGEIDVHPSGKFLFASNRGDNSIAVFAVDPKRGSLKLLEIDSTRGKTPRNFALDPSGSWLLAANQDSDDIVVFRVDSGTGHLTAQGAMVPAPSPACIKFVSAP